jgi:hypothetical protein
MAWSLNLQMGQSDVMRLKVISNEISFLVLCQPQSFVLVLCDLTSSEPAANRRIAPSPLFLNSFFPTRTLALFLRWGSQSMLLAVLWSVVFLCLLFSSHPTCFVVLPCTVPIWNFRLTYSAHIIQNMRAGQTREFCHGI